MPEPAIQIRDLSFTYPDGTTALSHVSLSVGRGESVGIIGHNGSGKSTLFMTIVGINDSNGSITVDGIPLNKSSIKDIRHKIGFVFHDARDQLFMSRVIEDVAFGPLNAGHSPEDAYHRAEHALEMVGLAGFGDRVSYHLSGGEMRRAAIASVLAMSPEIVVMDEPSAGLDPRTKRELVEVLQSLACTKLIASHDLGFIRACTSRVVLIEKGHVIADGVSETILDDTELLLAHGL